MKQSRWVPDLLGGFNVLAAVLALLFALALMLAPDSAARLGMVGWLPIFLAEIATGLWLLLARQSPARHQADA